ncbi:hypothetical protein PIB30_035702 [Stylosanthes scabra]|uniref:Cytochrome P450 n=1 Tax=Stylosanthes scabra TaxID=79078 RepID=A0ABU6WBG4_9FABA|nr:hypothetical protein [Stylosanthes scabra]
MDSFPAFINLILLALASFILFITAALKIAKTIRTKVMVQLTTQKIKRFDHKIRSINAPSTRRNLCHCCFFSGIRKGCNKTYDVIFASRPKFLFSEIVTYNCTDIAFSPYGNYWKQLRKISTSELFTPKRVNSFKSIREEEFNSLIKRIIIDSKQSMMMINLTEEVISTMYAIISRAAFGSKCRDQEEFITIAKEVAMIGAGFNIGEFFPSSKWIQLLTGLRPKLERLRIKGDKILENIINDHKDNEGPSGDGDSNEDLVDVY